MDSKERWRSFDGERSELLQFINPFEFEHRNKVAQAFKDIQQYKIEESNKN